jgi:hypothetical protein
MNLWDKFWSFIEEALQGDYKKPMDTQQAATTTNPDVLAPDWSTPEHVKHNVRVLCDLAGMSVTDKNILCAVVEGESGFYNTAINHNKNSKGEITSTDWGICQINDRYHIGQGNDFPSVQYVLDNPEKVVDWMIKMYQTGHINWWCAYDNGRYKQFLPVYNSLAHSN